MLSQHRAHQQSAVASPQNRELLRTRPFLLGQIFGRRRKIVEAVLLLRQVTALMPILAKPPPATNIRDHINPPVIKPNFSGEIEIGLHAEAVTAVAIKQGWIITVE